MDSHEARRNNPNGINLGGAGWNHFNENDRFELTQASESSIGFTQLSVEEKSMIGVGAQFITSDQNQKTFGASKLESQTSNSALGAVSRNVSEGIEWLLDVCSMFMGGEYENVYKLNCQFYTDEMTPQEVQVWMQAHASNLITKEDFVRVAQRAGIVAEEEDAEEYVEMLDEVVELPSMSEGEASNTAQEQADEITEG